MRRTIIIGLLLVTLAVIAAAVVFPKTGLLNSDNAGTEKATDRPSSDEVLPTRRIAIASRESLLALVQETKQNRTEQRNCIDERSKKSDVANAQDNAGDGSNIHGVDTSDASPAQDGADAKQDATFGGVDPAVLACQFESPEVNQALIEVMSNRLESQLSGFLAQSGRLSVAEPSSVLAAFQRFTPTPTLDQEKINQLADKVQQAEAKKSLLGRTREDFSEQIRSLLDQADKPSSTNAALATDFSVIAEELGAEYFLFVDLYDPDMYLDATRGAYQSGQRIILRANPLFVYRLYDVANQRVVLSSQGRLGDGLAIDLDKSVIGRLWDAGFSSDSNAIESAGDAVRSDLQFERLEAVAAMIGRAVLDEIAPAQIASADQKALSDPVIITRGSNDGVQEGDTFDVRQPELDQDNKPVVVIDPATGAVLDTPTTVAGQITVTEVAPSSNSATARRVGEAGRFFRQGDLLIPLTGSLAGRAETASASSRSPVVAASAGAGPLGSNIKSDRAARIAVTEFDVSGISTYSVRGDLQEQLVLAMTRRLMSDKRYQVVDRHDLDRIQEEYDLSQEIQGRIPVGDRAPVQIAGYLVTGTLDVGEEETRRSVSLRGETQALPSTFQLRASGEVRILDSASAVVAAKRIDIRKKVTRSGLGDAGAIGALADAYAFEAAKVLRNELYPLKIVQVSPDGKTFVINGGEDVGLTKSLVVNVYALGEPVIDPDSQIVLSKGARTFVGTLRVTDVDGSISSAVAKSLGGATLQAGYVVELTDQVASAPGAAKTSSAPAASKEPAEPDVPF